MNWNHWIRQTHRWLSIAFTVTVIAGATPARLPLAWLLAQRSWIAPIPGTTKHSRLEENLGAAAITLAPEDLGQIDRAASAIELQGARYPETLPQMIDR